MRGNQPVRFVMVAALSLIAARGLAAQEAATVEAAAKVIDLRTFPLMPEGVVNGPRLLASLGYSARGDVRGAFAFQKEALEKDGWEELPGVYLSDQSCSGVFGKAGFKITAMTIPSSGPKAAGMVDVMLQNLGDVDLGKLPVPPGVKPLYAFPSSAAYVAEGGVAETAEALNKLLTAQGWVPYGEAGDARFFKKNAVRLTARPSAAPAQGGKTVIQFSTELMSVDLPAPAKTLAAAYADVTKTLAIDVDMKAPELAAFYRESLGKAGWKATTENPVKIDFRELLIFRNEAKDLLTLKMHEVDGRLRATLDHKTAAEDAEIMRLAEAAAARRKAESEQYAMKAAEEAARNNVTVSIAVPADARDVKYEKDGVEFSLPTGRAKPAVEAIRADLSKAGWKGDKSRLDSTAGSVTLNKKTGVILALVYIDAGFGDATVTISAIGAEIAKPKAE